MLTVRRSLPHLSSNDTFREYQDEFAGMTVRQVDRMKFEKDEEKLPANIRQIVQRAVALMYPADPNSRPPVSHVPRNPAGSASRFRLDSWPRDHPGVELHILQGDALMVSATVRQSREFSLMLVDLPRGQQVRNINDIRFSSMHVRAMVTQFARLTIASEWRVVVMHGPEDVASVRDAIQAVCNAGIESAVWVKTNVRGQSRKRLTDAEEYITIGHMDHSSSSKRSYVKGACAHDGRNCACPEEPRDKAPGMTNVFAYSAVNRKLRFPGSRRAANMYQKPVKLVRQLVRLYSKAGSWVLDMCSGSGTGAVSALLERRNVIAVDVDPKQVAFVKARIQSLGTLPDEDQEIGRTRRDPWSVHVG